MATHRFLSGELSLEADLLFPEDQEKSIPGLVIAHGFPTGETGGANSPDTLPELGERISKEMGWAVMVPHFRGMGESEGFFSLDGWREDLKAAINHFSAFEEVGPLWLAGFGTGGALSLAAAVTEEEIKGVAALAAPADFKDWAENPRRLLLHARDAGLVNESSPLEDFDTWRSSLSEISAERSAENLAFKSLLVVHGTDDEIVPPLDARAISGAHTTSELRMISGAGHHLRHDPRAIAILLGWLSRQYLLVD